MSVKSRIEVCVSHSCRITLTLEAVKSWIRVHRLGTNRKKTVEDQENHSSLKGKEREHGRQREGRVREDPGGNFTLEPEG